MLSLSLSLSLAGLSLVHVYSTASRRSSFPPCKFTVTTEWKKSHTTPSPLALLTLTLLYGDIQDNPRGFNAALLRICGVDVDPAYDAPAPAAADITADIAPVTEG